MGDLTLHPPRFLLAQNIFYYVIFTMHVQCVFCHHVLWQTCGTIHVVIAIQFNFPYFTNYYFLGGIAYILEPCIYLYVLSGKHCSSV